MRPLPRIDRVTVVAVIALIGAFPAAASSPPLTFGVVQRFFRAYTAGDLRGAADLWVQGAPAEEFLREHRRRMERRCLRLETLIVDLDPDDDANVITSQTFAVRSRLSQVEWMESARSRFVLKHDGRQWRIAEWRSREREVVDQLEAAPDAAARAAILDGSRDVQTTTFVRLLSTRAVQMSNQRRFAEADAMSDAAIRIAGRLGDAASLAAALSARSVCVRVERPEQVEASAELAREAVSFADGHGDPDTFGRALYRLARGREQIDGVPDLDSLQRAMSLADEFDDASLAPAIATHLSRAYEMRGRTREATHYAVLAGRYAEETSDPSAKINAWLILGGAYLWIGDSRVALRHFRRAFELSQEAGFPGATAMAIGGIAVSADDTPESLQLIDEGLRTIHGAEERQWLLRSRAGLLHTLGRRDEAEQTIREAIALAPPTPESRQGIAMLQAALAQSRGDYATALAYLEDGRGPNVVADAIARRTRASILMCLGQRDEARRLLEELIVESESGQLVEPQISLFRTNGRSFQRLFAELLLHSGEVRHALEVLEQLKVDDLRNVLTGKKDGRLRHIQAEERERHAALENRIHELNRSLYSGKPTREEAEALRAGLADAQVDLLEFRQTVFTTRAQGGVVPAPHHEFRLGDLPAHLDHVTFVSYAVHEEWAFAFVVGPKRNGQRSVDVRTIGNSGPFLAARVARFMALVEQRNLRVAEAAAEMYDLLLRPLAPLLGDATTLCIIPDASLWHVPFHALGPRNGRPLIERMPVFYAPSLNVLAAAPLGRRERRAGSVLALANPRVSATTASLYRTLAPDAAIGAIPETELEVRAIGRIYGSENSRIYVGDEARESVLKREAPRHDILHIATHGLNHQHEPMFSSLLLTAAADDVAEDGLLEAREISELDLDADLAVLSACETGKAEDLNGDGVIGLSWALLAAGCRTTVVSQWKAQSAATTMLMVEFHRRLARGASKPEALRAAQLAVRSRPEYRHPFYWAPFIVIGAP